MYAKCNAELWMLVQRYARVKIVNLELSTVSNN